MTPKTVVEELYWSGDDTVAFTEGRDFPNHVPPEITQLAGTELEAALICVMKLRDSSGNVVGFGSELEVRPDPTISRDPIDCYFTIVLPGRGAFVLYQLKRNRKASYVVDREARPEPRDLYPTCGPAEGDRSVILAGTGEFAGVTGSHYQIMQINRSDPRENRNVEHFEFILPG